MIAAQAPGAAPDGSAPVQPPAPARRPYLLPVAAPEIAIPGVQRGRKSVLREVLEAVVVAALIFVVVQTALPNRQVLGQSMEPTLQNDQRLFLDGVSYIHFDANLVPRLLGRPNLPEADQFPLGGPRRGDIVVFLPPVLGETQDYIKRVIAGPGETVAVKAYDGVYVNGAKLAEPYVKDTPDYTWPRAGESGTVPAGHVFVLGDNRRNSSDSHVWGFLDSGRIIGRALLSYWPRQDVGLLPHPVYPNVDGGRGP